MTSGFASMPERFTQQLCCLAAVTFSHKRNKKLQGVNLQYKRLFWPEAKRWVRLRLSTKAMKTVEKKGLAVMAKEAGLDLYRLPFEDARPQRLEWLAQQPKQPPMVRASLRCLLSQIHNKPLTGFGAVHACRQRRAWAARGA